MTSGIPYGRQSRRGYGIAQAQASRRTTFGF
jgi:hypothetical protein